MDDITYRIRPLDHGIVELLGFMGGDLDVVNAAKVSFASYEKEMNESSIGLVNFLMKNKHATPFEHSVFKFYIKCPIFVAREWFRHRWSSFNEMSMRYHVPKEIDFYLPEKSAIRKQVGKPGHYTFEEIEDVGEKMYTINRMESLYKYAEGVYRDLLDKGVAKEVARSVLPVGQYTEFIWTVNARSLVNFVSLRNEGNAQYEIREFAAAVERIFEVKMPYTYKAFIDNNREAI